MKQMMKYIILFSIIVSSLFFNKQLVAQNYQETLNFALNQYDQKNYSVALKSFKRLIYFNTDGNLFPLYTAVAEIAFLQHDFETSQYNYGLAYNVAKSDSLKNEMLFGKAYSQILNKNYHYAIIDLLAVKELDKNTKQKLNFYLGTCYFGLEQFDRSKKYFKLCLDTTEIKQLDLLFSKHNLLTPSPRKARILSMLMPGLGQFYVGKYRNGLNSFLLSVGLVAIGIRTAVNIDPLYALISVAPWFQRYYTGGYTNAEKIAIVKRQNKRSTLYNSVIDLIVKGNNKLN